MGTSTCLFSRARPGKSTLKKVRGFLSLPAELRNQVYQYYFEPDFRCEIAAKGSQLKEREARTVKLYAGAFQSDNRVLKYESKAKEEGPLTVRVSRPLGQYNIVKGLRTNWLASLFAINLVCKQIHAETLPYLYRETTFVFDASNRLLNFLGVISSSKLHHITKLQIHYATYGNPRMSVDRKWKEKHNQSWVRSCSAASKKLVDLRELEIWIRVHDDPPRFNLRETWVAPLLQFRRLGQTTRVGDNSKPHERKLKTVHIDLRTKWSGSCFGGNQELAKASEDLHCLFGGAIRSAILGAKEELAMRAFNTAWNEDYHTWQFHLGFAETGW
ncbi:hypothetical protein CC86DRAFT_390580 [Ophiobolus disseminans]|uniref:DUF7730 domain-containing protein n=1 Tax=Ophiobolus disseminans TaxID=1469910 RepID=A0A6A7AHY2_9PLEO|nr:hypothetical protein CC86DRAFT_390580 [Ophiobolus disseminans]